MTCGLFANDKIDQKLMFEAILRNQIYEKNEF